MAQVEIEAANVLAPEQGKVAVVNVGTSSARTNLADAAQLGTDADSGSYLTLAADGGKVWFHFHDADSGTADETATSGANRVFVIPDGGVLHFRLVPAHTWLVHKASAANTKLRIYRSSAVR